MAPVSVEMVSDSITLCVMMPSMAAVASLVGSSVVGSCCMPIDTCDWADTAGAAASATTPSSPRRLVLVTVLMFINFPLPGSLAGEPCPRAMAKVFPPEGGESTTGATVCCLRPPSRYQVCLKPM